MDTPDSLATDDLFDALAHARRRRVLARLQEHETVALPDLAEDVATTERDAPLSEISPETVKRVYGALYHTHVPKLVDVGLVDYDQELDLVRIADAGRDVDPDPDPATGERLSG